MSLSSLILVLVLALGPAEAGTRKIVHNDGSVTIRADPVDVPSPLLAADFAGRAPLTWVQLVAEQHGVDIHVPDPAALGFRGAELLATDVPLSAESTWNLLNAFLATRALTLVRDGHEAEIVPLLTAPPPRRR